MTSAKLAKVAGLLLIIGPAVDLLVSVSRPATFPTEIPGGVQAVMQAGVFDAAGSGTLHRLMVDIGFIAAFGLLIGFWALDRVMGDTDGRGHLRKIGMIFLTVALGVRTAAFAMGFLLGTTVAFLPREALEGSALDTAVMFLVMEGSLAIFATILVLVGAAFFAVSLMNANLLGPDKLLNGLMGVVPAVVGSALLLVAPLAPDAIFGLVIAGNLVTMVQVAWIILLGVALVRKSDSFTAVNA